MKFLGIDYGSKRIGIACSDESGTLAFPFRVVANDAGSVDAISAIVRTEGAGEIVLGESLAQDGSDNAIMEAVREFGEQLGRKANVPVSFEKEFFTSVEARRMQGGGAGVDASAAALILQRYLDKRANK